MCYSLCVYLGQSFWQPTYRLTYEIVGPPIGSCSCVMVLSYKWQIIPGNFKGIMCQLPYEPAITLHNPSFNPILHIQSLTDTVIPHIHWMFFRELGSSLKDGFVEDTTTIKPWISFHIPSNWSLTNHPTIRRYIILDVCSVVYTRNRTDRRTGIAGKNWPSSQAKKRRK